MQYATADMWSLFLSNFVIIVFCYIFDIQKICSAYVILFFGSTSDIVSLRPRNDSHIHNELAVVSQRCAGSSFVLQLAF